MKFLSRTVSQKQLFIIGGFILLAAILAVGLLIYQFRQIDKKNAEVMKEIQALKNDQAATAKSLGETIALLDENLSLTKEKQAKLQNILNSEQERIKKQADTLKNISGKVGTLEKLTYTDDELLQKYSKVYFLNENYIPARLSLIDPKYVYGDKRELQIHTSVKPFLEDLLNGDTSKDFDLRVISAYRSFGTQADLKSTYKMIYGQTSANQFSADQGYSEHQLGTTVDFTTVRTGEDYASFKDTYDYQWLLDNAYKYGFVLSYPEDNAYYRFEPWHWRFVGIKLATKLHEENKHFYDLDQREIDKYLPTIFDR